MRCPQCKKREVRIGGKFCDAKCYHDSTKGMISPNHHRKGKVIGQPIGTIITAKNEAYKRIKIGCMKWQRYHRWIVERHIGRKLLSTEHVHHINRNQLDNRMENLMILSNSEHTKLHAQLRKAVMPI